MPFRFLKQDGSVEAGLRRIATEQIDAALASLESKGEARAQAVHDVRKSCKKLRGLIRLVRPAFAPYGEENAAFREVAGLLGTTRDAKVMQDTFDAVLEHYDGPLDASALAHVRALLEQGDEGEQAEADLDTRFAEARTLLQEARERVAKWSLEQSGWEAIAQGLGKTYSRARKDWREAVKHPDGERHHEWRKRVKYHWHHARLLRDIWPARLKERAHEAHALAELLGDHHDCHVLEERLRAAPFASTDPEALEAIIALTRRRRAHLEERAHRLGKRLQVDEPKRLVRRWGKWWDSWHHEGDLHEAALGR